MDRLELGKRIGQLRGRETQEAFGQRLGVSRVTVWRWETGLTAPHEEILASLGFKTAYVPVQTEHQQ